MSADAKKLLQNLLETSDSVRSNAIKSSIRLAPAEQGLLYDALFDELAKEEKINSKIFKTYLDLSVELKQQSETVARIKSLPIDKISAGLVGQMTSFVKNLDEDTKESLKAFLNTNRKLTQSVNTIFR